MASRSNSTSPVPLEVQEISKDGPGYSPKNVESLNFPYYIDNEPDDEPGDEPGDEQPAASHIRQDRHTRRRSTDDRSSPKKETVTERLKRRMGEKSNANVEQKPQV